MKNCKIRFIIVCLLLIIGGSINATPIISNVNINVPLAVDVDKYGLFEISFDMNTYSLPHDPNVINAYCEFTHPASGKTHKVYAFYYRDYIKGPDLNCGNANYNCERLTGQGYQWKIRFSPEEEGLWEYKITAIDVSGVDVYPASGTVSFQCSTANKKGFIVKANEKFLKRTTGEFVFPVGHNHPTYDDIGWRSPFNYGTNEYKYDIDKLHGENANFMRVWLDVNDGISLIGKDFTTGSVHYNLYNQRDAWQVDEIIRYAETKNIDIMLCFFNSGMWGDYSFANNNWTDFHPFNSVNGGPCNTPYDIFSNPTAIKRTKDLFRFIVSRWGYSTSILSWELWNEYSQFPSFNTNPLHQPPIGIDQDYISWHHTMFNYVKQIDAHQHLITTSGGTSGSTNQIYDKMDLIQEHFYKDFATDPSANNQGHIYLGAIGNPVVKPISFGEWGENNYIDWESVDPNGLELHNTYWSTCFSTCFGAPAVWDWEDFVLNNDLYHLYNPITTFMSSLEIPSESFEPGLIVSNGLRTYYMANLKQDTIYGWSQDENFDLSNLIVNSQGLAYLQNLSPSVKPASSSNNHRVAIPVSYPDGSRFKVEWYDSETGLLYSISNNQLSLNGEIEIYIPFNLRTSTFGDGVFKVYLDCDFSLWKEKVLNTSNASIYTNVASDIVSSKNTLNVFYKTFNEELNGLFWDDGLKEWVAHDLNNATPPNYVAGDIVTRSNEIFYRSTNGNIHSVFFNNTTNLWQYSDLNNITVGNVKGPIAISPDGLSMVYRTLSDGLEQLHRTTTTSPWSWSNLNNQVSSGVGDAIVVANTTHQVFYKTNNNDLGSIYFNPNNSWQGFVFANGSSGNVFGNITIINNNEIVFKNGSNSLSSVYFDNNTNQWYYSNLSNAAPNNVLGNIEGDNLGRIFYRTTNDNIHCIYEQGGLWHWSSLHLATTGNVKPISVSTNDMGDIFFKGPNNKVHKLALTSQCDYLGGSSSGGEEAPPEIEYVTQNDALSIVPSKKNEFFIYPNPAKSNINIESDSYIENYAIYDINNRLILSDYALNKRTFLIDVSSFSNGLYLIKVKLINGNVKINKVIIAN